jgi:hypothetical protein
VVLNPSIGVGVMDVNNDCSEGDYSMGSMCLSEVMRGHMVGEYMSGGD